MALMATAILNHKVGIIFMTVVTENPTFIWVQHLSFLSSFKKQISRTAIQQIHLVTTVTNYIDFVPCRNFGLCNYI